MSKINEVRRIIDNEAVYLQLVKKFSCQVVYFKKTKEDFYNSGIAEIMKQIINDGQKIETLRFVFHGDKIVFPNYKNIEVRGNMIRDFLNGYSYLALSAKYGRTVDNIRKITKKYRQAKSCYKA